MQAVVFPAPETAVVERVPDPSCKPDEVVVRVGATGICGTDLHIFHNEYMSKFPVIPGHEFGGEIVEVGQEVTDFRVGERVAVDPNLYCGHCYFCRTEKANHCLNWEGVGITRPGSFAQYVAAPARAAYRLPDTMTDAQAAFVEPVSCVANAMKRLRVYPADDVLIFGAGPMGLVLLQVLRHSGAAKVVVVEKQPDRLQLARQLGAAAAMAPGPDQAGALRELAPYGFSIVIDATGIPAVIEQAFNYLAPRGQYLQFGVTPNDATIRVSPYDIFHKDWTIIGSFAVCYTFEQSIAWIANGVVDVKPLISDTLPLSGFISGFESFAAGKTLKVQLLPNSA
jgi:2-desacetyl-2-hydroxyethyl bacteriochlorophyllide A dehydrogenase